MARTKEGLQPGEWAVLALLSEHESHGFAIARELSAQGSLGDAWTVPRPRVYQALEALQRLELVEPVSVDESTGGRTRTIVRITPAGARLVAEWLEAPVEHVRDVRSLLMLKVAFRMRQQLPLPPLLNAQRDQVALAATSLEGRIARSDGFERVLSLWRFEAAGGVLRFIDTLLADESLADPASPQA